MMEDIRRWVPVLVVVSGTLLMHRRIWHLLAASAGFGAGSWRRALAKWVLVIASLWMTFGAPSMMNRTVKAVPSWVVVYLTTASLSWVMVVMSTLMWLEARKRVEHSPRRRQMLALAAPVAAAPVASMLYGGYIAHTSIELVETRIRVKGLPKDLDGLRIAQLTDIHYGPFLTAKQLRRAVAMANETKPQLTVLTGDLITRLGDDLEGCLDVLLALRADAGVYGCHGNHENYSGGTKLATALAAKRGFRFLQTERETLRFGNGYLNLTGHDYQRVGSPYLPDAENLVVAGAYNVLLQHNPDVFPRAAEAGFDLTLSGHTHGGQINVELLNDNVNVPRVFTPYVKGRYELDGKQLYVSSGVGTVGMPVRLGAPPEVTLIRLCAI